MTEGERDKFGWWLEVVQQHFKGKRVSLTEADIKPGNIYVLDWKAEETTNIDSVTVEYVDQIEMIGGAAVALVGSKATGQSSIFVSDMVALAVGGPFPMDLTSPA